MMNAFIPYAARGPPAFQHNRLYQMSLSIVSSSKTAEGHVTCLGFFPMGGTAFCRPRPAHPAMAGDRTLAGIPMHQR